MTQKDWTLPKVDNIVASAPKAQALSGPKRNPALDGIRGIAVLLVLFCHYFAWSPRGDLISQAFRKIASVGGTGVDLFFVLSGFLITGILIDSKGAAHFLRNFYMRRLLRIFPLYYGFLLLDFFVFPLFSLTPHLPLATQSWYWSYTANIGMTFLPEGLPGPFHFWSLCVEEHFYLIWPFLIRYLPSHRLQRVLVAILAGSFVFRLISLNLGVTVAYLTPCRLDGLALGSMVAIRAKSKASLSQINEVTKRWMWVAIPIAAALYAAFAGTSVGSIQVAKYTFYALAWSGFLVHILSCGSSSRLSRVLSGRVLTSVGKYSYGIYVIHVAVFGSYARLLHPPASLQSFLLVTAITFCIAVIVWHVWERPFLSLKPKFEEAV